MQTSVRRTALVGFLAVASAAIGCHRGPVTPARAPAVSQPAPSAPGLFEDVASNAGIRFQHTNGADMRFPLLQTAGGGCGFLDYDRDGLQDVILLSSGEVSASGQPSHAAVALFHNLGGGRFEEVTSRSGLNLGQMYGQAIAVADYDNDGYPDVFVAGYGGCKLFHNRGGATTGPLFEDVTQSAGVGDMENGPRWASAAAWGDYDNDGRLDLYVAHYAVWSPAVDKKCPRPDGSPGLCEPDLYDGDTGRLFHNLGNGRFEDVTKKAGIAELRGRTFAVAWVDYDNDGKQDLFVVNDRDPHRLLHNVGGGRFVDVGPAAGIALSADGAATSGMGVAVGDFDGSLRDSLFVTNLNGEGYSLFANEGKGLFSYRSDRAGLRDLTYNTSAWGTAFADLNRDGLPDIVTANGHVNPYIDADMPGAYYEEPLGIYENLGSGRFQDISTTGGATTRRRSTRGLAIGDFDNDGRLDLLCINRNGPAELFRNLSDDKNHWIRMELVGTKGNRDGVGARVILRIGNRRMSQTCRTNSSYASSNDKRIFFGLGRAETADEVTIQWPSGRVDVLRSLAGDRQYEVTEGGGVRASSEPGRGGQR